MRPGAAPVRTRGVLALLLAAQLLGGCAAPFRFLVGQRVRIVDVVAADPAVAEASWTRALAGSPLSLDPVDERPPLVESGGATREAAARKLATTLRIPWLVVREEGGWRAVAAWDGRRAGRIRDGLREPASALTAALEPAATLSRLAPVAAVHALRQAFLDGPHEPWSEQLAQLLTRWPADPAPRLHAALPALLRGEEPPDPLLPGAVDELHALALASEQRGRPAVASALLQVALATEPQRTDLLVVLARTTEAGGGAALARDTLLPFLRGLDPPPAAYQAPEDRPSALPAADVFQVLGRLEHQLGHTGVALRHLGEAGRRYATLRDSERWGDTRHEEGICHHDEGRPRLAVAALEDAVTQRRNEHPPRLHAVATALENRARALAAAEGARGIAAAFDEAADAWDEAGEREAALTVRIDALPAQVDAEHLAAVESRAASIRGSILEDGDASRWLAELDYALGEARSRAGASALAIGAYDAARSFYAAVGDRLSVGQCDFATAIPLLALGQPEEALVRLERARTAAMELGDIESVLAIGEYLERLGASP